MVTVDCFSKAIKLKPLHNLPTGFNTAELLFTQVFIYYGIPEDIVCDRGLQFISKVWRGFFKKLGVTVSLTSGFYPQENDQAERTNHEIGWYLMFYCSNNQKDLKVLNMGWIHPKLTTQFRHQKTHPWTTQRTNVWPWRTELGQGQRYTGPTTQEQFPFCQLNTTRPPPQRETSLDSSQSELLDWLLDTLFGLPVYVDLSYMTLRLCTWICVSTSNISVCS